MHYWTCFWGDIGIWQACRCRVLAQNVDNKSCTFWRWALISTTSRVVANFNSLWASSKRPNFRYARPSSTLQQCHVNTTWWSLFGDTELSFLCQQRAMSSSSAHVTSSFQSPVYKLLRAELHSSDVAFNSILSAASGQALPIRKSY